MGEKTDPVLFQLPPSLSFDLAIAEDFFSLLRKFYNSNCEGDFLTALASRIKALLVEILPAAPFDEQTEGCFGLTNLFTIAPRALWRDMFPPIPLTSLFQQVPR
jgi:hypothetical protein